MRAGGGSKWKGKQAKAALRDKAGEKEKNRVQSTKKTGRVKEQRDRRKGCCTVENRGRFLSLRWLY